jgi:hypothetical protein
MTDVQGCRTDVRHSGHGDLPIRWCQARCYTCKWSGPRVTFAHTAERHRQAHLYVGRHRAES